MSLPVSERPRCFIDIETSGLNPDIAEILSFAAAKEVNGKVVSRLSLKIRPQFLTEPPPWACTHPHFSVTAWQKEVEDALRINGYTESAWVGAIPLTAALHNIVAFVKDCVIVGQNPSFDLSFLEAKIRRAGLTDDAGKPVRLPYHKVDTVTLAYEHLAPHGLQKLSLINVCEFLGISNKGAHTADADVDRCRAVYHKLTRATIFHRWWWKIRNWRLKSR